MLKLDAALSCSRRQHCLKEQAGIWRYGNAAVDLLNSFDMFIHRRRGSALPLLEAEPSQRNNPARQKRPQLSSFNADGDHLAGTISSQLNRSAQQSSGVSLC